jgi:hypothetical protein
LTISWVFWTDIHLATTDHKDRNDDHAYGGHTFVPFLLFPTAGHIVHPFLPLPILFQQTLAQRLAKGSGRAYGTFEH